MEERGEGNRWSEMQFNIMPKVDETLVGFKIEMLFDYPNEIKGGTYIDWAHGVVEEVINSKSNRVLI